MATDKPPTSKGQAWFCTTGLPSDIVIEVDDMIFHLHKFPLMSMSRKLQALMTDQESIPRTQRKGEERQGEGIEEEDEEEEGESDQCLISLPEFPGGSETFELAAKFCYGSKIEITPANVAPLRCAGEYLEMTEDFADDNLISRTESFLARSVLLNPKHCVQTLKSCEPLLPLADALAIPRRCVDSIAACAASSDPSLFGWPVADAALHRKSHPSTFATSSAGAGSWLDDLTILGLPIYKRVIAAMEERNLGPEIIESALIPYAKKSIPGISRSARKKSAGTAASEAEQRELLETIVANLPSKRGLGSRSRSRSTTAATTRFLFGLLRTANILRASEGCRAALERRIAEELEQATLDDLLMPSYSYLIETLYDVECVERILGCFLEGMEEEERATAVEGGGGEGGRSPAVNPVILVGKLIDGYLAEIASDANLGVDKFCDLAVALPDHARVFDDGLYRAVDVYLKAHPWISEEEREKVCAVMDCQKLTLEACTHAAQNERLPVRAVVQVLFFEQLQLRQAIAGSLATSSMPMPPPPASSLSSHADDEGDTWRATIRENQVLRLDMDSMRSRVHELERECSTMRKAIQKIDRSAVAPATTAQTGGWTAFTKKFGCKFKTQVCDSHEGTVVEAKKV